mmetsp:Transcript_341/g.676  ORF Transcript_341/g.676 Transcript_341/m.676 type:complete len:100 (-) Transcript_341:112-411(-)
MSCRRCMSLGWIHIIEHYIKNMLQAQGKHQNSGLYHSTKNNTNRLNHECCRCNSIPVSIASAVAVYPRTTRFDSTTSDVAVKMLLYRLRALALLDESKS